MLKSTLTKWLATIPVAVMLTACSELPGNRNQQGAVIGGAAGAAVGAGVAKDHRALGAILGGALGAAGGYVIAAKTDKTNDTQAATEAARKAQENPATAADAKKAMTADLNMDGFVTLDEVVAMKQAGFNDEQMIARLKGTDQVFDLTSDQEKYLTDHGLSSSLVKKIEQVNANNSTINAPAGATTNSRGDVIGQPAPK